MQGIQFYPDDAVIGTFWRGNSVSKNALERHEATVESFLRSELIAIWQRDELPFEAVLEKIEGIETNGWEATLEWLGHFYLWDSYKHIWDASGEL